jgi:hypothetical protein
MRMGMVGWEQTLEVSLVTLCKYERLGGEVLENQGK